MARPKEVITEHDRLAEAINDYLDPEKAKSHKTAFQTIIELSKLRYDIIFVPYNKNRVQPQERNRFVNLISHKIGRAHGLTSRNLDG